MNSSKNPTKMNTPIAHLIGVRFANAENNIIQPIVGSNHRAVVIIDKYTNMGTSKNSRFMLNLTSRRSYG